MWAVAVLSAEDAIDVFVLVGKDLIDLAEQQHLLGPPAAAQDDY